MAVFGAKSLFFKTPFANFLFFTVSFIAVFKCFLTECLAFLAMVEALGFLFSLRLLVSLIAPLRSAIASDF